MQNSLQQFGDDVKSNIEKMKQVMGMQACMEFNKQLLRMLEALYEYFPVREFPFSFKFREAMAAVSQFMGFDAATTTFIDSFSLNILEAGLGPYLERRDANVFLELRNRHGGVVKDLFEEAKLDELWPEIPQEGKDMIWAHFDVLGGYACQYTMLKNGMADQMMTLGAALAKEYAEMCTAQGIEQTQEACARYVFEKSTEFMAQKQAEEQKGEMEKERRRQLQ
jgi:hypothetical protein